MLAGKYHQNVGKIYEILNYKKIEVNIEESYFMLEFVKSFDNSKIAPMCNVKMSSQGLIPQKW